MSRKITAAALATMIAFLLIAGTRLHRFMDAPNKLEATLGVQALGEYGGHADLRNIELYPGYIKIETGGDAGDPTTWDEYWYRATDVKIIDPKLKTQEDGSTKLVGRSIVIWAKNTQVVVEHQQPLVVHGALALRFEMIGRNAMRLVITPAMDALLIGALIFLWLVLRNTPERVKTDETGRFVRPRGPRVDLNE